MKAFFDAILLAVMAGLAVAAAAWEWLPSAYSGIATAMNANIGGFNWSVAGGVIFLGVSLLAYMKMGKVEANAENAAIDYRVPRNLKVKVLE